MGSLFFDEMGACVLLLFHAMKRLVAVGACRPCIVRPFVLSLFLRKTGRLLCWPRARSVRVRRASSPLRGRDPYP